MREIKKKKNPRRALINSGRWDLTHCRNRVFWEKNPTLLVRRDVKPLHALDEVPSHRCADEIAVNRNTVVVSAKGREMGGGRPSRPVA